MPQGHSQPQVLRRRRCSCRPCDELHRLLHEQLPQRALPPREHRPADPATRACDEKNALVAPLAQMRQLQLDTCPSSQSQTRPGPPQHRLPFVFGAQHQSLVVGALELLEAVEGGLMFAAISNYKIMNFPLASCQAVPRWRLQNSVLVFALPGLL